MMDAKQYAERHGGHGAIRAKQRARNAERPVREGRRAAASWLNVRWSDLRRQQRPDPRS